MKTLVIGDIHGNVEIIKAAFKTEYPLIFVGDYLDSFNRLVIDQLESLEIVLKGIKEGRCIGIMGNHEMSYISKDCRCSGYNNATAAHIMSMDLSPLVDYTYCEGFLISHAGVSNTLLELYNITLQEYLEDEIFEDVGYCRGGWSTVGGLHWCDWNYEFKPIKSQPQIVGHTRGNYIRQKGNSYCIDCLEDGCKEALLIENGTVEIFKF